jgi:Ca2+-binding EF-hand superfamily protein
VRCGGQVDYNNDNKLEELEIEIAILKIYNLINKRLPGWQNPPTRDQIKAALKVFDVDGNGYLDKYVRCRFWSDD